MNREIKFRAWDKNRKIMFDEYTEGMTIEFLNLGGFIVRAGENAENVGDESQFELMQFTNLKDKNGKEIYEGDIVKTFCGQEGGSGKYQFDVVEFECGSFELKPSYENFGMASINNYFEIIGNIYENKDLLNN